jgi:hypothetical protein
MRTSKSSKRLFLEASKVTQSETSFFFHYNFPSFRKKFRFRPLYSGKERPTDHKTVKEEEDELLYINIYYIFRNLAHKRMEIDENWKGKKNRRDKKKKL